MFERYTEKARRVIFFGRYEASQFGSPYIETEHLLLGILREDHGLIAELKLPRDASDAIRKRIEATVERREKVSTSVDLPLSHASKRVLAYGAEESERLKEKYIAPVHLLMGLLREDKSLAAKILKSHEVTLDQVRKMQLQRINSDSDVAPENQAPDRMPTPEEGMLRMITGFWISRAIYVAAKLGLADLVNDGPKSVEELAAATGSDPSALYRLLRSLATVRIFREMEPRRFATTPFAQTLITDRPGTLCYFAMSELGQEHYSAWEAFPHSIRTGAPAFDEKFKEPMWDYYGAHPADAGIFFSALGGLNEWIDRQILNAYDFSPFRTIVDLGGHCGAFLAAVLDAAPDARGILLDRPAVIAGAALLRKAGLADRTEQVGGDFFEAVPGGGDVYILKSILQNLSDEQSFTILRNIRNSMAPGAKVLIIEPVLGHGSNRVFKNFFDLNYLVMTGDRIRTKDEISGLLTRAGFVIRRVITTQTPVGIVEAVAQ